ncbi:MAG: HAD family hydrolase [Pseudolysinimonas sp.]
MAAPSVVLFDLDDTVFAHRESVELGIAAHRSAIGGALAAADRAAEFARWNALEERHYHRYLTGELDFVGQRRERAREFVAPFGVSLGDDAADAWYGAYLVHYQATWMLHDDVLGCLEALRPARFGVITNGHLEAQQAKITATGLGPWLDHVIASGEFGAAKPDAAIFAEACRVFEVPPSDAVYVGDRLHTDAIGAARAGLRGVWIDRHGLATPAQLAEARAEDIPRIRSLAELPALLL